MTDSPLSPIDRTVDEASFADALRQLDSIPKPWPEMAAIGLWCSAHAVFGEWIVSSEVKRMNIAARTLVRLTDEILAETPTGETER